MTWELSRVITLWPRTWKVALCWSTSLLKPSTHTLQPAGASPMVTGLPHPKGFLRLASVSKINIKWSNFSFCSAWKIYWFSMLQPLNALTQMSWRMEMFPHFKKDTQWATPPGLSATLDTLCKVPPVVPAYQTGSGVALLPSVVMTVSPKWCVEQQKHKSFIVLFRKHVIDSFQSCD